MTDILPCRLCGEVPQVLDEYATTDPEMGHYEVDCGCGVCTWAQKRADAVGFWNRLMGTNAPTENK